MKIRNLVLSLLLVILATLTPLASLSATPAAAAPPVPRINWAPCYRDTGFPFECAVVPVPLDYSKPGAASISLAVTRLPAGDKSQRIGSLFLNPGGPGGSGVNYVVGAGPYLYTPEVRARFDLVGFDPRGIARSTALKCFGNAKQAAATFAPFAFPMTTDEEALWEAGERAMVAACDQRAGRIIDHMTTADVARDLDLLRQAVGDAQLNYAGVSYGTYLGVTYANLFPGNVRALIVDGVLDPIAWATGSGNEGSTVPFSTRLRSDVGAQATLDEFFRLCDTGVGCAFAPDSAARYAALAAQLKVAPVPITLPDGSTFLFKYSDLIGNSLGPMYDSASWPDFAQFLAYVEAQAAPALLGNQLWSLWQDVGLVTKRGQPNYPNYEGFPGVACSDSNNPTSYQVWWDTAIAAEQHYGYFGRLWTWVSSICATWQPAPSPSRYAGPFTANTAHPVLVIGNIYDPATRYQGAVTVHGLLPNSALLTLHGWGHTSLFLSQCVDSAIGDYLVRGITPAPGTVCEQDFVPFAAAAAAVATAPSAAAAGREGKRSAVIGDLLPIPVHQLVH